MTPHERNDRRRARGLYRAIGKAGYEQAGGKNAPPGWVDIVAALLKETRETTGVEACMFFMARSAAKNARRRERKSVRGGKSNG